MMQKLKNVWLKPYDRYQIGMNARYGDDQFIFVYTPKIIFF